MQERLDSIERVTATVFAAPAAAPRAAGAYMVPGWKGFPDRALSMKELSPCFPWNATERDSRRLRDRAVHPQFISLPPQGRS